MTESEAAILSGQAWAEFCDALKTAGAAIMRPETPATPLDRAEAWRFLSRLARVGLEMNVECADPDFPVFYRATHDTIKILGDNPDTNYANATISGTRRYRLTGRRGTAPCLTFGTKANRLATEGTLASTGELDALDMQFEPDGRFEIALSRDPQPGNWLPLAADSTMLLVRETFLDRRSETPTSLAIDCLDRPPSPAPLSPEALRSGLAAAAAFVNGTTRTTADWLQLFRRHPNQLPPLDQDFFQRAGGHPSIHYRHGYWELRSDEALEIQTEVPDCTYWNFVLQNYWMESTDYRFLPSYLNARSARYNADGTVTILVAARDPGAANFITTAGHASGSMLLRWVGATEHPTPRCRVLRLP